MKPYSTGRARINSMARKLTDSFLEEFNYRCWFCGRRNRECVHVHHIASGTANKPLAMLERFTWASACDECNCGPLTDKGEESGAWPIKRQLAVKYCMDRSWFKLRAFNRLRGHAPDFITLKELKPFIRRERYRLRKLGLVK
jgi:hypothetical protein